MAFQMVTWGLGRLGIVHDFNIGLAAIPMLHYIFQFNNSLVLKGAGKRWKSLETDLSYLCKFLFEHVTSLSS